MRYRNRIAYGYIAVFCGFIFLLCIGINVYNANANNINKFVASIVDSSTVVQWEDKYKKLFIRYKLLESNLEESKLELERLNNEVAEAQKLCDELSTKLATATEDLEECERDLANAIIACDDLRAARDAFSRGTDIVSRQYENLVATLEGTVIIHSRDTMTISGVLNSSADNPITLNEKDLEGVTAIPDYAFSGCKGLLNVVLPDSVTSIGAYAFYNCSSLINCSIPASVTSIGYQAFSACTSLKAIIIPGNVETIGDHAFLSCSSLESVSISEGVKNIGDEAFYECRSLTSVIIPSTVECMGSAVFEGCSSLKQVYIYAQSIRNDDYYLGSQSSSWFYKCYSGCVVYIPQTVTDPVTAYGNKYWNFCSSGYNGTSYVDVYCAYYATL